METHIGIYTVVLVTAFTVGCASHDGSSAPAETDWCNGAYACTLWYGTYDRTLQRDADGRCMLSSEGELRDDHTTRFSTFEGTWSGDLTKFKACFKDAYCETCVALTTPDTPSTPGACSGYVGSCTGRGSGTCSLIRGCYPTTHIRYDGSLEMRCDGTATQCSRLHGEASCLAQGCRWN